MIEESMIGNGIEYRMTKKCLTTLFEGSEIKKAKGV